MVRRKARPVEVEAEPADPEPEIPVPVAPPDPVVRAILAGPPSATQARLSDLLSAQPGIEVFARFERADQVLSSVHELPARRGVAVLIDTGLPGLHDAGWLIRRLRERVPVLRLFAYAEQPDDPLMEHVALAGVDEVLVLAGPDSDDEVVEAFVRQFHLSPVPEEPAITEEGPVTQGVPPTTTEVLVPPEVTAPLLAPVQPAQERAVGQVMPDPPPPPLKVTPAPAPTPVPPAPEPAPAPVASAPEPTPAPVPIAPEPVVTPVQSTAEKRGRFHRRSGKSRRSSKAPDPASAQDGPVESAALRNLERELAAAQRPAPEVLRRAASDRPTSTSDAEHGTSGDTSE